MPKVTGESSVLFISPTGHLKASAWSQEFGAHGWGVSRPRHRVCGRASAMVRELNDVPKNATVGLLLNALLGMQRETE